MRALLIFSITFLSLQVLALPKDSIHVLMTTNQSDTDIQLLNTSDSHQSSLDQNNRFKFFKVTTDWLLETKAEIINGISYSPTIEFNLRSSNGFNFQLQTGALPIFNGLKIQKTQPAAGISFSYKF